MSTRVKADLTLLLVAVIWGSAFVAQRIAAQQQSVFMFNGLRFLIGALALLPFTGLRWRLDASAYKSMALVGAILFTASALQQWGIQYTTAGNAGFITSLYVVFVPIILWAGWREKPGWVTWLGVALAAVGAYLLSTGGESLTFRYGDLFELAGAVFWGLHMVVVGKIGAKIEPMRFSAGQFAVTGVLALTVGMLTESPSPASLQAIAIPVLYTGIFSVGIGYTLQVVGQRHTPPADAALILSLESVLAVVFGWIFLGEYLVPLQVFGCLLIMAAVVMVQVRSLRAHPELPPF